MKLSLQVGSREMAVSIGKSGVSPSVAAWLRGDDLDDRPGTQMVSAYQQSVWVYACITAIAEQIAQIPVRFSRTAAPAIQRRAAWRQKQAGETIIESGPLVDLFNRPHPQLSRFQFWELIISWVMLRGEFFVVPLDANAALMTQGVPKVLAVLPPDNFRADVRANRLAGWLYTGQGDQSPAPTMGLLPEDLICDRLSNPYDFWRGMSPLTVALLAAATDFASAQFMRGLISNNASVGTILRTDQPMDDGQREQLLAAYRSSLRKAGTANRPVILSGGLDVVKPTLSSTDMQFLENRKFNRQEICAAYKVPQEVLGYTEDANRAVSETQRLNFIENRIAPLCERLEAAFDRFVKRLDAGLWLWFDIESLSIMQSARRARYAAAKTGFDRGVPVDVVGGIFDLGLPDDLPHAGKSYLPFNLQEVGGPAEAGTPNIPPPPPPAPQAGWDRADKVLKRLAGTLAPPGPNHVCAPNPEYEAALKPQENVLKSRLARFFFEQRGRLLLALSTLKGGHQTFGQNTLKGGHQTKALDALWNAKEEDANLLARIKAILIADLNYGGAQLFTEIGAGDFNVKPAEALSFLDARKNAIRGINQTTWDALKVSLSEGIAGGESYNDLADRVKDVFKEATDLRAEMIALTETNCAINSGRHQAMVDAGVERKGWQTSHLENTRATHLANEAFSEANNGIAIDDIWPNGCAYPGDPEGEPGETINCRCFGYAILTAKEGK